MHAAVVGPAGVEALHVGRLRIGAEIRVVGIGRARMLHVADRPPRGGRHQHLHTDQPARLRDRFPAPPLPHEHAKHVGEMLVERPRLAAVVEIARERLHAMRELVSHHIERPGESLEDLTVAIPIRHLATIPEGIVERLVFPRAVRLCHVHAREQRHAVVVQRIATTHFLVEVVGVARKVIGLVHRRVGRLLLPFAPDKLSRQPVLLAGVVDEPVFRGRR